MAPLDARSLADLISLHGRQAVVTGGARGIGGAICARLAEAGANVVVADLDVDQGTDVAARLSAAYGVDAVARCVDVRHEESVNELADWTADRFDGLHIWINNAGVYPRENFLDISAAEWDEVLNVNLRATFVGSRAAARHMIAGDVRGTIVNVASTAGFRVRQPGFAHYVSAKHAVRGLTKALAVELGSFGIRALAVAPGLTDTPGISGSSSATASEAFAASVPLGRVGTPDDVATVVLFCASDLSRFMSGCTLLVDGGDIAGARMAEPVSLQ